MRVGGHMQAVWLRPLLAAMGADAGHRPYKGCYARQARLHYPEMNMGRELLGLNLNFRRITEAPADGVTGEMRQAFRALAALPPLRYVRPGEEEPTPEREHMRYDDLVDQPLFLNPIIARRPRERRATDEEEDEMMWYPHRTPGRSAGR